MTMTDPIADMLTRLRNANQAYHDSTTMPHSKIKAGIAAILQQQGYITGFEVSRNSSCAIFCSSFVSNCTVRADLPCNSASR